MGGGGGGCKVDAVERRRGEPKPPHGRHFRLDVVDTALSQVSAPGGEVGAGKPLRLLPVWPSVLTRY